ncbi:hypothetical protein C4D60_Mb04t39100 [Musa balbisiana]|uniref:Uncharacterized protein n=1 Tax=Musa balbisiana TaxID=52838 RepID=A0A4S8KHW9_MUSBA|nr:hypothetical protein C4D60_Mb04t39100 [Musa balbisiana]
MSAPPRIEPPLSPMAPPPIPAIASSSHLVTGFVRSFYRGREVECSTGTVSSEDPCPVAASATTSRCSPPARIGRSN